MSKKSSILKFEIISTIFIMIVGTLLHFTFGWSNNNPLVGTFSAVNESTWEHLKLLFFPMLIIPIIILLVLCLCFLIFTFFPLRIALFEDPITGSFGI